MCALLLLCLAHVVVGQPPGPAVPPAWNITSCAVTNLTASTVSLHLTVSLGSLDMLYVVLPASNASSSLFPLSSHNPARVNVFFSAPPADTSEYLALYSAATNASDPQYAHNTVVVAGLLSATGSVNLNLSLSLPPSSVSTVYYLLADTTADPPLYGEPLTLPATTNLTVQAACVAPPLLGYCANLAPSTLYASYLDPYSLDAHALSLYAADLSLFSPSQDCSSQRPNASLCYDCLVVRQRWRCATTFDGCTSGGVAGGGFGGPCQWLCAEKNSRCGEVEDCSVYATTNCNAAWAVTSGTQVGRWLVCALVAAVVFVLS